MTGFGVQVVGTTWRRCPSCPRAAPVDRVSGEHFCAHYRDGGAVDIPTRCTPIGAHIDLFPRNAALQFSTRTAPSPVWPRPDGSALAIHLRFTRTRRSRGGTLRRGYDRSERLFGVELRRARRSRPSCRLRHLGSGAPVPPARHPPPVPQKGPKASGHLHVQRCARCGGLRAVRGQLTT